MLIEFDHVFGDCLEDFSLCFELKGTTVIHDPSEQTSPSLLSTLVGLEPVRQGEIRLDGTPFDIFFEGHELPRVFGHIFDEGIMLSNLSLQENLLLPYQWLHQGKDDLAGFEEELGKWLEIFNLKLDLSQRPALFRPAALKLLSYIRTLMLKPQFLIIDDPYYLFNKNERSTIFRVLDGLRADQTMLIASADDDFTTGFADQVIEL